MKCKVSCECGKLEGTAALTIPTGKAVKPVLAYSLTGEFRIEKVTGALHPVCNHCGRPAMTRGEWSNE